MTKLRKVLLGLLVACTTISAGLGLAACAKEFPNFKNPTDIIVPPIIKPPEVNPNENKYTVNVKSDGGMPLNDVQVAFKKDGETKLLTVAKDGVITVNLPVDTYTLEVDPDSLPAGYYLPEDMKPAPISGANGTTDIKIPSKVITSTATSSKRYVPGDIMHDFSYVNSKGETKQLSELLKTKKAVLINFFFVACGPCQAEFPVIEKAYNQYKDDLEFVALSNQDSATAIKNFQAQQGYSFDMGYDASALYNNFSVSGYPTSIMVDRYGAVAYRSTGTETRESTWVSLFARFTAPDYQQVIDPVDPTPPGVPQDYIAPPDDIGTPDYDSFVNFINGDGANGKITAYYPEEDERNWPWQLKNDETSTYLAASNTVADHSFAIVCIDVSLRTGDILSFEYNVNCAGNYDTLAVIMDSDDPIAEYSGNSDGWQTEYGIYVANRDVTFQLAFAYQKLTDPNKPAVENEFAGIRNITVENVANIDTPFDFARSASVEGLTVNDIELGDDGYYHIVSDNEQFDGATLFVDLWNKTAWSTNRAGTKKFTPEGSAMKYDASMYHFSFWELSDYATVKEGEVVSYLYTDLDDYLNLSLELQKFSKNGYFPVTLTLKQILEEFCEAFKTNRYHTGEYEEGEWIEMCYFFQHYNGGHKEGENCSKYSDPISGMAIFNSLPAHLGTDNHVNIDTINSLNGGGRYYNFTPETSGVYRVRTIIDSPDDSPSFSVFESDDGVHRRHERYFNTDLSYNNIINPNSVGYVYLEAGKTVYLQMMQFVNTTATYNFAIEYVGETYEWLRTASTAGGMFLADVNENNEIIGISGYGAVNSALNDDDVYYTYSINSKGEFVWGSKLYIDFIHDNFIGIAENKDGEFVYSTLKTLVEGGLFNLSEYRLDDYTQRMTEFYNEAISGKTESDELYGLIEANSEIVEIIATVLEVHSMDHDGFETGYWKSVACYYEHIGPESR